MKTQSSQLKEQDQIQLGSKKINRKNREIKISKGGDIHRKKG